MPDEKPPAPGAAPAPQSVRPYTVGLPAEGRDDLEELVRALRGDKAAALPAALREYAGELNAGPYAWTRSTIAALALRLLVLVVADGETAAPNSPRRDP